MLPRAMRGRLALDYPLARDAFDEQPGEDAASADDDSRDVKQRTADSFAYEWQRFGALQWDLWGWARLHRAWDGR